MKLVDILARELKVWPEGVSVLSQLRHNGAIINGRGYDGREWDRLQIAEDTHPAGVLVTEAQWQAAVDALKDEKERAMFVSDPIKMRIQTFGDAAFSLLKEQYENKTHVKIGDNEFVLTSLVRKFFDGETVDCGANIQEFIRVKAVGWNGDGLPPVGSKVSVVEGLCTFEGEKKEWLGIDVLVVAAFKNALQQDIVAVENSSGECACFIVECIQPIRTPEQIAAEERDKAIADLYFTINWDEGRETWPIISSGRKADYAKAIDAGYRKQEA